MKRNQWSRKIIKYGDSLGVTIPPDIVKELGLEEGERYLFTAEKLKENGGTNEETPPS